MILLVLLKDAVLSKKTNIERFPERFCFQLTEEELEIMWSQIVTTSKLEDNK